MKSAVLLTAVLGFTTTSLTASNWTNYNVGNSPIPSNTITSILTTETDNWIGTDNGLAKFDGSTWEVFQAESSELVDDGIYDLHQDSEGDVWVVTALGITRINEQGWEVRTATDLPNGVTQFRSIDSDQLGNIWVGTWGYGMLKFDGSDWIQYTTENSGIPSNGIFEVSVDETGTVWVGTFNEGLVTFDGQNWTVYNSSNSDLPNNNVRCIEFDFNNNVWIGTDDGLARRTPLDRWDVFTYVELGHSVHSVRDVIRSETGNMYFATDGGLIKFENFVHTFYTAQNSSIPHNNLYCVAQDNRGDVWVGTGADGAAVLSSSSSLSTGKNPSVEYFQPYPNPTNSDISLALTQPVKQPFEISIFNTIGQVLYRESRNSLQRSSYTIPLDNLPNGTYIIRLISDGKTDTKRVIKS